MQVNDIVIIGGKSQYGAVDYFIEKIALGFSQQGVKVHIINALMIEKQLSDIIYNTDLVVSFNGIISDNNGIVKTIDRFNIPCWHFLVDHPYFHHIRLLNGVRNQIISVIDRKHLDYLNTFYKNTKNNFFVPHGGAYNESMVCNFNDKKYDLAFIGSYCDSQDFIDKLADYTEDFQEAMIKSVEDVWNGTINTLEESVLVNLKGYKAVDYDNFPDTMSVFEFLDDYIRSERRTLMIKTALKSGYDVHVFGNGWDLFKNENSSNLIIHDGVSYEESLKIMSESKIVLNNMPLFSDGSHERVLSAMASGSICLTDSSKWLKENFVDGIDLFYYDWNDINEMIEIIDKIMTNKVNYDEIINNGRRKVVENHLWSNRAKTILSLCEGLDICKSKIESTNLIDTEMSSFFDYIENTDSNLLYESIIGKYKWFKYMNPYEDYIDMFGQLINQHGLWGEWEPEENNYEVIKNRVDVLKNHISSLKWVYNILQDYTSKKVICNVLLNWVTFSPLYLNEITDKNVFKEYFDCDILSLKSDEVFVDISSNNDSGIMDFIDETSNKFKRIYCYGLNKNQDDLFINRNERVINKQFDGFDENEIDLLSVDEDIEEEISFLKCDLEGSEMNVLKGAKNHIKKDHPKLAVAISNNNHDIYRIMEYIYDLDESYKFYIRYYGINIYPSEIVLYCI